MFYEKDGKDGLSTAGWDLIGRILASATDLCLVLSSSIAYPLVRPPPASERPTRHPAGRRTVSPTGIDL